ncbi:MAG TPA: ABC transporter permease subunit [Hyphomicrobiales bacterium]|nr:ABC transporter permease subunit [Hyphomicrobiales bacterium]
MPNLRFSIQAALFAAALAALGGIGYNVAANLQKEHIHFGLGFLSQPAGFSVLQSLIPFDESSTYGRAFVVGLLNTLLVAAIGIAFATVLGFGIGLARLAHNRPLRWLAAGYVELFRNLPLLLILFFFYFVILRQLPPPRQSYAFGGTLLNNRGLFLPGPDFGSRDLWLTLVASCCLFAGILSRGRVRAAALGLGALAFASLAASVKVTWPELKGLSVSGGLRLIPEFVALAAALSIYTAAYIAEIVRAGIQSVSRGQVEAAEALGFSGWQTAWLVVIPQALRLIVPPLTSQYLNLTKNSSLAVAIAYPDLVSVFAGTTLAQTGQAVEIMAITMGVYLFLSLLTAGLLNWRNVQAWA